MTMLGASRVVLRLGFCLYIGYQVLHYPHFNSTIFQSETNYLHWSSSLPAVTLCQVLPVNTTGMNGFLDNLAMPTERYCKGCENPDLPTSGYRSIIAERVDRCSQLLTFCSLNDVPFECCSRFKYLPTERSPCFSLNSEMTGSRYKLEVSHFSKEIDLKIIATKHIQVYLHDPKELGSGWNDGSTVGHSEALEVLFRIRQTIADFTAGWTSAEVRGCRLQGELPAFPVYSQAVCRLACLARAQDAKCHCQHHLLPTRGVIPDCDLKGLLCLDKNFNKKKEKKIMKKCKCMPACDEVEVYLVWSNISRSQSGLPEARLTLTTPPTERLILKAKSTPLDALVVFACAARLFTNMNILNIFKYFLFTKKKTFIHVDLSILY